MKLRSLSIASITFCVLGFISLLVISGYLLRDIQDKQEQIGVLSALEKRVSALTAAGHHLLLYYADEELRSHFRDESESIRQAFLELDAQHPGAGRVGAYISLMDAMIGAEHQNFADSGATGPGVGPLGLSRRGRIILGQFSGHGIAMEGAVTELLHERQQEIARQTVWTVTTFALAALLFAALCVVAFGLIHARVRGPITELYSVVRSVSAGDLAARVRVRGRDEIAELGRSFNALLEAQDQSQAELTRYERELEERARMLAESQRIARVGSMRLHIPTQRLKWSDESCRIFGLAPDEFTGAVDDFLSRIHGEDIDPFLEKRARALRGEQSLDAVYRIVRPDGSLRVIHQRAELERNAGGEPEYLVGTLQDVTEQRADTARLRRQEVDLRSLLDARQALINSLPAHIALLDPSGVILDVNANWRQYAEENGYLADNHGVGVNYLTACEKSADAYGAGQQSAFVDGMRGVLEGRRASFSQEYFCGTDERPRWFRVTVNRLKRQENDQTGPGAVVMHMDITERKLAEERLNRLAFDDPLTGVLTRNGFSRELASRLEQLEWDVAACVVMLDLISLRSVNDAHGFAAGDRLLRAVATRLRAVVGEAGLVGRVGGDEFVVYLPMQAGGVSAVQRRLAEVFDLPFQLNGFVIDITPRFGFTAFGANRRPVENLLREAELALFQGTEPLEGCHWARYTSELDAVTRERITLTRQLRKALERDELELHFQPKVDLRSGEIIGAEALLRWFHPERGMIPPAWFIPLAEQGQLIGQLGQWVLENACKCLGEWQRAGLCTVPVAINVSVLEFRLGDYTDMVSNALRANGLAPGFLSLEITESVFESEGERLIADMHALQSLGLHLSLDDFGTGYSSLLYLKRYPFDELKIDREFVNGMLEDRYSREIVRTVINMARVIDALVVAEGVETQDERDALLDMGCELGQGYYFSKPLTQEAFRSLLASENRLPLAAGERGGSS